jgi:hypothetical protein
MRAEQIQAHLERGRRALESGDHEGAFSACEQVFVLEPQNLQALELEEKTRSAVEQVWAARGAERAWSAARSPPPWLLTERVLGMNADSPKVELLRQAFEERGPGRPRRRNARGALQRQMQQAQQEAGGRPARRLRP